MWYNIGQSSIHVMRIPEEKRMSWGQNILKETVVKYFPNLM